MSGMTNRANILWAAVAAVLLPLAGALVALLLAPHATPVPVPVRTVAAPAPVQPALPVAVSDTARDDATAEGRDTVVVRYERAPEDLWVALRKAGYRGDPQLDKLLNANHHGTTTDGCECLYVPVGTVVKVPGGRYVFALDGYVFRPAKAKARHAAKPAAPAKAKPAAAKPVAVSAQQWTVEEYLEASRNAPVIGHVRHGHEWVIRDSRGLPVAIVDDASPRATQDRAGTAEHASVSLATDAGTILTRPAAVPAVQQTTDRYGAGSGAVCGTDAQCADYSREVLHVAPSGYAAGH